MKWKSTYTGVPVWVNVIHYWLEFLDYEIVGRLGSWLCNTRNDLVDRHCRCSKCLERLAK